MGIGKAVLGDSLVSKVQVEILHLPDILDVVKGVKGNRFKYNESLIIHVLQFLSNEIFLLAGHQFSGK